MKFMTSVLSALAISTIAVVANAGLPAPPAVLLPGTYGGQDAQLTVTNEGGSFEFDCAAGAFQGVPEIPPGGFFTVAGTLTQGTGVESPTPPAPMPVTYSFQVSGANVTVTIEGLPGGGDAPTFSLVRDQAATIFHCE
jgi:hypothetical protein